VMNERRPLNYKDFLNRRSSFLPASEGSGLFSRDLDAAVVRQRSFVK
jgi:hypothetical protein